MILNALGIRREEFIFCHQLKNFSLSENIFEIYFSIFPSEEFFENPEKDTTGGVKNSYSKNCNQNHSKIRWRSLFFTKRALQRMLFAFFYINLGFWNEAALKIAFLITPLFRIPLSSCF